MIPVNQDNYFDVAEGLHWFCVDFHAGQNSTLYRVQCQLQFNPSPLSNGPDSDEAQVVYEILSTLPYQEAEELAETLREQIYSLFD